MMKSRKNKIRERKLRKKKETAKNCERKKKETAQGNRKNGPGEAPRGCSGVLATAAAAHPLHPLSSLSLSLHSLAFVLLSATSGLTPPPPYVGALRWGGAPTRYARPSLPSPLRKTEHPNPKLKLFVFGSISLLVNRIFWLLTSFFSLQKY